MGLSLLVVFGISICTRLFFTLKAGLGLSKQSPKTAHKAALSVIVAARNEAENIADCLRKLAEQEYPEFELIAVNDRSEDETGQILAGLANEIPFLRVLTVREIPAGFNGKKFALMQGIRAATYEHLVFTDADCRPASRFWLSEISAGFSEGKEVVLGFSPYVRQPGLLNFFIRYESLQTAILYLSAAKNGRPYMGVGRNLAYRKSLFGRAKGFEGTEKLTGGDDDLFVNKTADADNTAVVFSAKSAVLSLPKESLAAWFAQKKRHLSVGKRYKTADLVFLGIREVACTLFWISFPALLLRQLLVADIDTLLFTTGAAGFYWLAESFVLRRFLQKTGEQFELWALPFADLLYFLYFSLVGTAVFFTKKIKWK